MRFPEVSIVPIHTVRPNRRNARTHSKRQIKQIAKSIDRFGFTVPIVTDEARETVSGTGRLLASRLLGLKQVPIVVVPDLTEVEKIALALADNKIAANAGWDRKLLATQLAELSIALPEFDLSIEDLGFEAAELDNLVADLGDNETSPDSLPEIETKAISVAGDLWRLGQHLVLCGDSGREADVAALFGKQRASMIFADPPYNVRVSNVVGRGKRKHREFVSGSGEFTSAQFVQFLTRSFTLCASHAAKSAVCCCCMDWRHMVEMREAGSKAFSELLNLAVWVKNNPGQGSLYRSQHELIFIFRAGSAPHQNNVQLGKHGRNRSNVWEYPRVDTFRTGAQAEFSLHPTVKPLALVADAILDCTRRHEIVYDPFLGSGTTIVAAEKVGRRGFGIEIDPLYVDVAIRRWQAFTRSDAILVKTGQTFDDLASGITRRVRSVR